MYFVPLKHIIVCILYPKLHTGRRCLLRYLMQKEALCISYPQFIGAKTLKKKPPTVLRAVLISTFQLYDGDARRAHYHPL